MTFNDMTFNKTGKKAIKMPSEISNNKQIQTHTRAVMFWLCLFENHPPMTVVHFTESDIKDIISMADKKTDKQKHLNTDSVVKTLAEEVEYISGGLAILVVNGNKITAVHNVDHGGMNGEYVGKNGKRKGSLVKQLNEKFGHMRTTNAVFG